MIKKLFWRVAASAAYFEAPGFGRCFQHAGRYAEALMPLRETEAIILRSYPLAEADRLVSFLSRAMGRVRGVAAGARKPKSRFGSTLERLSYVRIWFFERETRDLVRISQCEMIESFLDVFRDYAASVALSLFSEITEALLPEREASDANFRLLLLTARTVKKTGKVELGLAYFSLWAVRLGGWLPSLDRCMTCGRPLSDAEPSCFSARNLLIGCGRCRRAGMRAIPPGALALGRRMLTERLDSLSGDSIAPGTERKISDAMLDVIENQIGRKLTSRELLESPV